MKSIYENRVRPRKRAYLTAPLGLFLLAILVYFGSSWLSVEIWDIYYSQMVFPGSYDIDLSEPGDYSFFYEFETTVGDVNYHTPENLEQVSVRVVAQTGEEIQIQKREGGILEFHDRKIKPLAGFFIFAPGRYRITATAVMDLGSQNFVLSLGPDIPIIYSVLAAAHSIFTGLLVIAGVISPIVVWRSRKGSREFLAREAAKRMNR
jgi:hypothetical protein